MSRPKPFQARPEAVRPLSPAAEARLKAMRDELWSRCVEHQAALAEGRRHAGWPPEPVDSGAAES